MGRKLNVLFISPYENMQMKIREIGMSYPDINLTVTVGNEAAGQRLAQKSYNRSFDCVISRGNTAELIRQAVSIPVIEVKVTLQDVLDTLSAVPTLPPVIAAVGYRSVVSGMDYMNRFLPFNLEVFAFDHLRDIEDVFARIREKGIGLMVCDTITYQLASMRGFDARLLNSGEDSVRLAFDRAMLMFRSTVTMLEENQLLRRLVSVNSESETVVFSSDKRLYYSSLSSNDELMDLLRERLVDFEECDRFKIVKQQGGYLYRITAKKVTVSEKLYYAYFISRKIPNMQHRHKSIHYYNEADIRAEMDSSVFGIANIKNYYSAELNIALSRKNPVMIYGEVGVGKNHLAEMIYLNSKYIKNPFVIIDCSLINRQSWEFLISRNESPLYDNGNTLFLKNIDAVDDSQLRQLIEAIVDGDVAKRNRLIISCSATRGLSAVSGLPVLKAVNQLDCLTISMLPLRGQYEAIKNSVDLLLDDFRTRVNPQVGPIQADAMALLTHYHWPQNYDQLIRVTEKIGTLAGSGPITRDIVHDALTTEMSFTQGETSSTGDTLLDLTRTLDEINQDIAKIILDQNGGNQSSAARSLGISRTTLWRMLKNGPDPRAK